MRREEPADREIDPARLIARELAIAKVRLMDNLSESRQAAISKACPLEECLEGAVIPDVAELGAGRIERDGFLGKLLWVTRRRPHVDRVASAWLIKRFIYPDATFVFADPRQLPQEAIPFDTAGAELSDLGDDCTFETLLKRAGLRDRRLARLAEIVHEADLRDGKFPRDEARGIDLAIRGLLAAHADDQQVLTHGLTLFEVLYAAVPGKD